MICCDDKELDYSVLIVTAVSDLLMVRNRWLTLIITLYHNGLLSHSHSDCIWSTVSTRNSVRFRINLKNIS